MGDFKVRKIKDAADRRRMYRYALNDIAAFESMLKDRLFDYDSKGVGAEQELCVVNQNYDPASQALQLLDAIDDPHYTNELALFNLEINLDPQPFSGACLSRMESELLELLKKGKGVAKKFDARILMAGILPTLKYRHLEFEYMTPIERYETLSKTLLEIRGAKFEVYLQGVDELILSLGSVLFEACNTSFQLHLQINPDEFVNKHNWSQMISGPVLSACVNSPILFGNELWSETRIALFKQSLDTRSAQKYLRKKLPRVYFGNDWIKESPSELWQKDVIRFPLLVTSDDLKDSEATLKNGAIPDLRAIRLHNGTTYTWNRLIYGYSKSKPHLRIECRYLPAGPSAIDEMANFAFWLGLMNSEPERGVEFWRNTSFKTAKENFIKAARTGLNSVFRWHGKNIPAKKLLLEKLLPMAHEGLSQAKVSALDIEKYLSVFEQRVLSEMTGADWIVYNFRALSKRFGAVVAQKELVREMLMYQDENVPVHEWKHMDRMIYPVFKEEPAVEQLMSTDIFSVNKNDSIELVDHIFKWKQIHHLPIEDDNGDLLGLITNGMIDRLKSSSSSDHRFAKDIMLKNVVSVHPNTPISNAKMAMQTHELSGLPVVYQNKLVGMITKRDLEKTLSNSSDAVVKKK